MNHHLRAPLVGLRLVPFATDTRVVDDDDYKDKAQLSSLMASRLKGVVN